MLALLLAVSLTPFAPDPVQTPASLLIRRLAPAGALDLDGPLASQALAAPALVHTCSAGFAPLGWTLWDATAATAQTRAEPPCARDDSLGLASFARATFWSAPPAALTWPAGTWQAPRPTAVRAAPAFPPVAPPRATTVSGSESVRTSRPPATRH